MNSPHSLQAQPYTWQPSVTKRRRLTTDTWISPPESPDPVQRSSSQTTSPARLDRLPAEILSIILDFSLEAALIHTSRQLWCALPSFVHYTKNLALKALVQIEDWPENAVYASQTFTEIAHVQRSLDPSTQRHVRRMVFSSAWFTERHLNQTHRALLYWTILQCCSWYGDNAPSRYQHHRIKSFIERQSAPASSAVLYLRVPSGGRRIRYLSAKQLSVTISGAPFFRPLSFSVLDFGGSVPDELLRIPLTTSKIMVIRDMCKSIWIPREENTFSCNRHLLHRALRETITFNDLETFHILLSLEERSRQAATKAAAVLDLAQIQTAVTHGRSKMLIRLLKQIWTSPGIHHVSDVDLVRIIDDAEANHYPDSRNVTRILAMEVAAKWKMMEIETTGRKAHRVPMDWPPRLIYPIMESTESQIWFIPRDPKHEVDWDASRDVPWLI
jgi:hypothetical protein